MAAYVDHRFNGGFILDEGKLRKIVELINNRYPPEMLSFSVYRGDSYSYSTKDVNHVIDEDNDDWRAIAQLEVLIDTEEVNLKLIFSERNFSIRITGSNRDTVFLLFSDLKEYINSEVLSHKKRDYEAILFFTSISVLLPLAAYYFMERTNGNLSQEAILASDDMTAKLNYLISNGRSKDTLEPIYVIFLALIAPFSILISKMGDVIRFINPTNQFLFGKNIEKFNKRKKLVSNIFWVVIVGALVSLVTGGIVWVLTK